MINTFGHLFKHDWKRIAYTDPFISGPGSLFNTMLSMFTAGAVGSDQYKHFEKFECTYCNKIKLYEAISLTGDRSWFDSPSKLCKTKLSEKEICNLDIARYVNNEWITGKLYFKSV